MTILFYLIVDSPSLLVGSLVMCSKSSATTHLFCFSRDSYNQLVIRCNINSIRHFFYHASKMYLIRSWHILWHYWAVYLDWKRQNVFPSLIFNSKMLMYLSGWLYSGQTKWSFQVMICVYLEYVALKSGNVFKKLTRRTMLLFYSVSSKILIDSFQ